MSGNFRLMKKLLLAVLLLVFIVACDKEQTASEVALTSVNAKAAKIDICHKGKIININRNALPAHQKHGDAVDLDGDGLFDIENDCSATDCDDSDAGDCDDEQSTSELLLGSWTTTDINVVTSVGSQSITDYLINVVGFSPEDAAAQQELIESALEYEVTGTLVLDADNTYDSSFAGGSDSGTWNLSADETTLTLFEGADIIIITINSITENTWIGTTGDDLLVDLDNDSTTPNVIVTAEANVIFIK